MPVYSQYNIIWEFSLEILIYDSLDTGTPLHQQRTQINTFTCKFQNASTIGPPSEMS